MKILLAFDSFKGTLDAAEACECAARGLGHGIETIILPMADGGEGSVGALSVSKDCSNIQGLFPGVYGEPVRASYCVRGSKAFIESAQTCGLLLTPPDGRDIMKATTAGVGAQIRDALKNNCNDITVCVGGTASNDGGIGMAREMGYDFLDRYGKPVSVATLSSLSEITAPEYLPSFTCTAATDVQNPLCGINGASRVYAMQKGATPQQVERLEEGMERFAAVVLKVLGVDLNSMPGSGAGGGLGGGLIAFLGAKVKSGFTCVAEMNGFYKALSECDAVITGEGKTDAQTAFGKVPFRVAQAAKALKKPCFIVSGRAVGDLRALYEAGATAIYAASEEQTPDVQAFAQAKSRLTLAVAGAKEDILKAIDKRK